MAKSTRPLSEIFLGTCATFQQNIHRIALVAQKPVLDVFAMWREYSQRCDNSDQSPLLAEFVEWYRTELGGDLRALRVALSAEYFAPEPSSGIDPDDYERLLARMHRGSHVGAMGCLARKNTRSQCRSRRSDGCVVCPSASTRRSFTPIPLRF